MIRKILVVIVCLIVSVTAFAAPLTATLQSGDKMTPFYGPNAFVEAYNAAKDGDIITLSPGRFNTTEIAKSIKIIGSYAFGETENEVTFIGRSYDGSVISEDNIVIEGARINEIVIKGANYLTVNRCYISNVTDTEKNGNKYHVNTLFEDCMINNYHAMTLSQGTILRNCAIGNFSDMNEESKLALIENCNINIFANTSSRDYYKRPYAIYRDNIIRIYNGRNESELLDFQSPSEYHNNCFIDANDRLANQAKKWNFNWSSASNDGNIVIYKYGVKKGDANFDTYQTYGPINHKSYPAIPDITSSSIDTKVDAEGNFHIKITAEARD